MIRRGLLPPPLLLFHQGLELCSTGRAVLGNPFFAQMPIRSRVGTAFFDNLA
jgi:hypothetical protein